MKKVLVALMSSLFIFVPVWLIVSILVAFVWPYSLTAVLTVGIVTANIASLIGLIAAGLAATHTFRASLNAKTGKLYRKNKKSSEEKDRAEGPTVN